MYTHGLEQIYAFETINPLTVKTVSVQPEQPANSINKLKEKPLQLLLYTEGLQSLRLKEPIHLLRLSPFALKGLLSRNVKTIEEAALLLQGETHTYKGLGQGHIEEIQEKIFSYIGKNPFSLSGTIDWASFVRIACHEKEPKMRTCFLARFDLSHLYPLASSDLQELSRWSQDQIAKASEKMQLAIKHEHGPFLTTTFHAIIKKYVSPWMQRRHGFMPLSEIEMRLYQIAVDKTHFWPIRQLLHEIAGPLPLIEVAQDVFACNAAAAEEYSQVLECIMSYFYQPFASYPLETLAAYVRRELAKKGLGLPDGFIEQVIKTSPLLQLFLNDKYKVLVQQKNNLL